MNTETGQILEQYAVDELDESEKSKYVPVIRDLSTIERYNKQIKMYSPCGCNSGKKFKFCCFRKKQ